MTKFLFVFFTLFHCVYAMDFFANEQEGLLQNIQRNPLLNQIYKDCQQRLDKEYWDYIKLIDYVEKAPKSYLAKVQENITDEITAFEKIVENFEPLKPGQEGMTYPLKTQTQKTFEFLRLTNQFIMQNEVTVLNILKGNNPTEFMINTPANDLNIYGEGEWSIYNSHRGLVLKLLLLESIKEKDIPISKSFEKIFGNDWYDRCPFITRMHVPGSCFQQVAKTNSCFYENEYLYLPHNGYIFGGGRDKNTPDDKNKPFYLRDMDCTSIVANYVGIDPSEFSTWHLREFLFSKGEKYSHIGEHLQLKDINEVNSGDVLLVNAHTGFVVNGTRNSGFWIITANREDSPAEYKNINSLNGKNFSYGVEFITKDRMDTLESQEKTIASFRPIK
ncbi:MAG: hypothetical protein ACTSXG_04100 [Alphaproteobacteria bacterium]